jgi:hypothetical protein
MAGSLGSLSMSLESVLIERARPTMLAEKARAMLREEICKGCRPEIFDQPVALEPPFSPIMHLRDLAQQAEAPRFLPATMPKCEDFLRLRVWFPKEWQTDFIRSELFLKQLSAVSHRVGFEISGNSQNIEMVLLCHVDDLPIVLTAFYGEHPLCELAQGTNDPLSGLAPAAWEGALMRDYFASPPYSHLMTRPSELVLSPLEPLLTALAHVPESCVGVYQALFMPVSPAHNWHQNVKILADMEYVFKLMEGTQLQQRYAQQAPSGHLTQMAREVETKAHGDKPFFSLAIRIAVIGSADVASAHMDSVATFLGLLQHGGRPLSYLTQADYRRRLSPGQIRDMFQLGVTYRPGCLVNSAELSAPVHVPAMASCDDRLIPLKPLESLPVRGTSLSSGTRIGTRSYAGQVIPVHIAPRLRGCHTRLTGAPGTGKSTVLEQMALEDIRAGYGVAVLDPHGDLVERLLNRIPEEAVDRTIYMDPGENWVPLWNPLKPVVGQHLGHTADELVFALKSFFKSGWGHRLEHLLRNCIFALLHVPGSTFFDIYNILQYKSEESSALRRRILEVVESPVSRKFWLEEFDHYKAADLSPPRHKLSQLLLSGAASLMLSQPDSALNFRRIMDEGLILLINLSGSGSEVRDVLGCLKFSLLHQTALSRSNVPPDQRRPFHIFCDEAHRFTTDALEDLIAETRKFGVSLTLAHQYLSQFDKRQVDALDCVGSTIIFNVHQEDARHLVRGFRGRVKPEDFIGLGVGEAIVRVGADVVRIRTDDPSVNPETHQKDRIIAESRRRYYKPANEIRRAIADRNCRWAASISPMSCGEYSEKEFVYDTFD